MKTFLKLTATLVVAFLFGIFVGSQLGFDPIIVGLGFVAASFLPLTPVGVFGTGLVTTEVVSQLQTYINLNKMKIWNTIRQGVELWQYTTGVADIRGKYAHLKSNVTELHQPFQKGFQPKGEASLEPYISESFHLKVDMIIDNIDQLFNGWTDFLTDETKLRSEWPFVKWIIQYELIPKMIEEVNVMSCVGVQASPTAGTAGGYLTCYNGLFTIAKNEVTAGNITAVTVGAITASNGVDKVESFLDQIPEKYKANGGTIMTSVGNARNYARNYRSIFGTGTNDRAAKGNLQLDDYNVTIVPLTGAGTKQRMIYIPGTRPQDRLLRLYNKVSGPDRMEVQLDKREVILLHDRWEGVGITTLDGIFSSDLD